MASPARGRAGVLLGLLVLAGAAWLIFTTVLGGGAERKDAGAPRAVAPVAAPSATPAAPAAPVAPDAPASAAETAASAPAAPPPVDLEKVDRDRDLHGVVLDGAGAPVAGASLTVERTRPGRGWRDGPHLVPQPEPLRALSATDGSFRFGLEWGEQVDLRVAADGFNEGVLHGCPAGTRLRVMLQYRGGGLEVIVRDREGRPVADARVVVGRGRLASDLMSRCEGRTDAGGVFVAEGLDSGRASIDATHPEFGDCPEVETLVPTKGRTRVEFVLDRGRVIEGLVLDAATGLPVAGARVGRNWVLDRPVTTDASGRFAFRGWNEVPGWDFGGLHCLADGYARAQVDPPADGPVEFRLERGFAAAGRVVGHDGRPVEGAEVRISGFTAAQEGVPRREVDTRRTATDAAGSWTQRDLRRGFDYEAWVRAEGHAVQSFRVAAPADGTDRLDAGTWVLPQGRRVEGVVLDAEGRPVSGVEVCLERGPDARVDDRGRFRIADAPPGERRIWVCRPDAYALLEQKIAIPEGGDLRDLVLRLPVFKKITVRVVDSDGRPLRGVQVYAHGDDMDYSESGEDGLVVLDQLKDEVVEISAEMDAPGNRALRLPASLEGVRPAGQEVTLVLEEGVAITGVVIGADGRPVHPADVWAVIDGREEDDWFHASTGERGNFEILVRKGQFFDLRAHRLDAARQVAEEGFVRQVAGPKSGVEIRLEPVTPDAPPAEAK